MRPANLPSDRRLSPRRLWRTIVPRALRRAARNMVRASSSAPTPSPPAVASGRRGPGDNGGIRRVQVGVGPHNALTDWWNVDIRPFASVDEVADMTQPWPWRDLEYVYGEHFLEHLMPGEAIRFLVEAARALRPNGRIRLSTPGLEWVWRTHFDPFLQGAAAVDAAYRANRAFHGWGHRFLYSRPMLEHLLEGCGFTTLTFHRYGESADPALRGMERHDGYEEVDGWPSVWIVEAAPDPTTTSEPRDLALEVDLGFDRYVRAGH
jgi:hypothetical protein